MSRERHKPQLGPVMAFTGRRADVVRFFAEITGIDPDPGDDATWFEAENAKLAIHDPQDRQTPEEVRRQAGFVLWMGVPDIGLAFERANRAGHVVGAFQGDYFFAKDPDGRYVGFYELEEHGHGHGHEH